MAPKKETPMRLPETETATEVYNLPFPQLPKDLGALKGMKPIVVKQPYHIDYIHSYGQDSPWLAALSLAPMPPSTRYSVKLALDWQRRGIGWRYWHPCQQPCFRSCWRMARSWMSKAHGLSSSRCGVR